MFIYIFHVQFCYRHQRQPRYVGKVISCISDFVSVLSVCRYVCTLILKEKWLNNRRQSPKIHNTWLVLILKYKGEGSSLQTRTACTGQQVNTMAH